MVFLCIFDLGVVVEANDWTMVGEQIGGREEV